MKVAWFTPATGDDPVVEYSREVLAAMAELSEPLLCCNGRPEGFPPRVPVLDLATRPQGLSETGTLDAVFYVLGNDLAQHAWIFEAARAHPGIVVLCDVTLHRFFLDYYVQLLRRPDVYVTRMAEHYGVGGLADAHRLLGPWFDPADARLEDEDLLRHTFTEEALRFARGAVVHSRWHCAVARRLWRGPVCEAWPPAHRPRASLVPATRHRDDFGDGRIVLMTLGPVAPRTGVDEVVEVLAEDPGLAARTSYLIVGQADPTDPYVRELREMIAEARLARTVRMIGHLPPVEIEEWARSANVFIDLRHPDDAECPISLMYQLPFGKPVVTHDAASIAEIPNEAIVRIGAGDRAALRRNLRELVDSFARRQSIGAAGRRFAERHRARDHAGKLLRFAEEDASAAEAERRAGGASHAVADRIADQVAAALSSLGVAPDWPGVDSVISEASSLLWPPSG